LAACYAVGHYAVNGWRTWKIKSGQDLSKIYRGK
jgi:hypothetical protein